MIQIRLTEKQDDFVFDPARFVAFIGGVGSGKTTAGAARAVRFMLTNPGRLGLIVAPTYPMLRDATLRTLMAMLGDAAQLHKAEMRLSAFGAEALLRSADKPDRLRGPNCAWAWIDEAALCPPGTWEIVLGRIRVGEGSVWVTSTPRGKGNWLYRVISMMSVHRATTADNPFLPAEFVRALQEAYDPEFLRQEFFGEFIALEGLVFDRFDRSRHVAEPPSRAGWRLVAGLDFGYTNPTALVVVGLDRDDVAWVLEEFYHRRLTLSDVASALKSILRLYRVEAIYCDPSDPGAAEELRRHGIPAQPAKPRPVLEGIREIQARFANDRLFIAPRCAHLIAELETYAWARDGVPLKANDHAIDALRYALASSRATGIIFAEG